MWWPRRSRRALDASRLPISPDRYTFLDLANLAEGIELTGYPDPVCRLAMSHDGAMIVASADDEISVWSSAPRGGGEQPADRRADRSPGGVGIIGFLSVGTDSFDDAEHDQQDRSEGERDLQPLLDERAETTGPHESGDECHRWSRAI